MHLSRNIAIDTLNICDCYVSEKQRVHTKLLYQDVSLTIQVTCSSMYRQREITQICVLDWSCC